MTLRSVRRPNVTYFLLRRVSLRKEMENFIQCVHACIRAKHNAVIFQLPLVLVIHNVVLRWQHTPSLTRTTIPVSATDASFHAACSKPVHSKSALPSMPCPKHRHPEVHPDWLHRSKARVSSSTLHAPKDCTAPAPYSATSHATWLQFPTVHPSKSGAPQGQISWLLHHHGAPLAAEPARLRI